MISRTVQQFPLGNQVNYMHAKIAQVTPDLMTFRTHATMNRNTRMASQCYFLATFKSAKWAIVPGPTHSAI